MSHESNTVQASPPAKRLTWKRRLVRSVLLYVVMPYLAIVVIVVACQRRMIYQPTKTDRLLAAEVTSSDVKVEDVALHAASGLTLHGWHFHAEATTDDDPAFLVIYFPGNAGCRRDRVADCRDFTRLGCDVVLFDYRGYGDNEGSPSEVLFAADARRAWLFATQDLHFSPDQIVLFGESLGGAVATRLAAEFSLAGTPPAALILNSTFASLGQTVAWHHPTFPFQYLLWDRFPSIQRIPHVTCAILQFHGTADDIVAFDHGHQLFDAAPAASSTGVAKRFIAIPHAGHNFIAMRDMEAAVSELLMRIVEVRPKP